MNEDQMKRAPVWRHIRHIVTEYRMCRAAFDTVSYRGPRTLRALLILKESFQRSDVSGQVESAGPALPQHEGQVCRDANRGTGINVNEGRTLCQWTRMYSSVYRHAEKKEMKNEKQD